MAVGRSWQHDKRSRHERGYGKEWEKRRKVVLKRDGYRCRCEDCRRTDALLPATQVDHIISKAAWLKRFGTLDGVDDYSNLQAINAACHERKGMREKGFKPKAGCSSSGLPLDPQHPWNLTT